MLRVSQVLIISLIFWVEDYTEPFLFTVVRRYVEEMEDADRLLDLIADPNLEDIEPTRASGAGRVALYPDVCSILINILIPSDTKLTCIFSIYHSRP